ncbi:hypothetical protein [Phytomonospora endophytica]|uniref:Uncharacterized protein n=1 Tax=Phytomonospora endophytica TaxID=714109 RepID=A0A841FAZ9_9ACTN|nr:hypothetical protein [Phytomonospora endophytica]MBB6034441.1 hypothetical protein [Phytomonospora endophytica]GIG66835.1 hypothetical protein Pen01_31300 [Phytomonospora endophytica]
MSRAFDEWDLAESLGHHAVDAPDDEGLLEGVHRRRRARARGRAGAAGGITVVVTAVAILFAQQYTADDWSGPNAETTASPGVFPTDRDGRRATVFPYRPGWIPEGFLLPYGIVVNAGLMRLGFASPPDPGAAEPRTIALDLYTSAPAVAPQGGTLRFRDTYGVFSAPSPLGGDYALSWQEDGYFFVLRARGFDPSEMMDFAEALRPGGGPGPGLRGSDCERGPELEYIPPDGTPFAAKDLDDGSHLTWRTIEAEPPALLRGTDDTVDLGEWKGSVGTRESTGDRVLSVDVGDGKYLVINGSADHTVPDDELAYQALKVNAGGLLC